MIKNQVYQNLTKKNQIENIWIIKKTTLEMANVWNTLAIIAAILGFLALLGAWFTGVGQVQGVVTGSFTKENLYYSAIALFVLAIVIWVGASVNAGVGFFPQ